MASHSRNGDGSGGGVAVALNVGDKALHGDLEAAGSRLDDALVCLVRDDQGDIIQGQLGSFDGFAGGLHHHAGGKAENFATVHLNAMLTIFDRFMSSRQVAAASRQGEQVGAGAIGTHDRREDASGGFTGLQYKRAGTIAKEDASVAVLPVGKAREGLCADNQHIFDRAAADQFVRRC